MQLTEAKSSMEEDYLTCEILGLNMRVIKLVYANRKLFQSMRIISQPNISREPTLKILPNHIVVIYSFLR